MMVLKIQSIIKLCEGVPCPSYTPQPLFLDSSSIVSLLRCLYEEVFIFHNVFATERSCKEKTIILNLWKIKGLNNKILSENDLFEETETEEKKAFLNEYGSKIERTKMQVEQLKEEINALCAQMDITPKAIEQIQDNIKHQKRSIKGYEFIKDGSMPKITEDFGENEGTFYNGEQQFDDEYDEQYVIIYIYINYLYREILYVGIVKLLLQEEKLGKKLLVQNVKN